MFDVNELHRICLDCFVQQEDAATFDPEDKATWPEFLQVVDCGFRTFGLDKRRVAKNRDKLVEILNQYPDKADDGRNRLTAGPSYIEVGAAVGDQGFAFLVFAVGEVAGLWQVITPKVLGLDDDPEQARELMGRGFIMIDGYRP